METSRALVLQAMHDLAAGGKGWASITEVAAQANVSVSTALRQLGRLVDSGDVITEGRARATRYALAAGPRQAPVNQIHDRPDPPAGDIPWSPAAIALLQKLAAPMTAREPVSYRRALLDGYSPGISSLLPPKLAAELLAEGRWPDQQPAGTYARKVLEQLLVELSWSSSKLEGNTYSLLDTERLFQQGAHGTDQDAVMLLNHKRAIEFLVDDGPMRGLTTSTVRNIHSLLMDGLMPEAQLGTIRTTPVYITGTTFIPLQVPHVLGELLDLIVAKARAIPNPIEAAYFLWVQIAYLQPFIDGNKRTSRICANIPLTLYNCSPLAFMDVGRHEYAQAMLGIYEFNDFSAATDLFVWTYRRSIKRYRTIMESMGSPDQLAVRYRAALTSAIGMIVGEGATVGHAVEAQGLQHEEAAPFRSLLEERLDSLQPYNSARYRISEERARRWIDAGRPR
ncbi:Fic family protein [Dyella marensis]|uniref:Fic family protein n=1 Tax=Dyella marensis TaxID=500610 RepID=UPI0031E1B555